MNLLATLLGAFLMELVKKLAERMVQMRERVRRKK